MVLVVRYRQYLPARRVRRRDFHRGHSLKPTLHVWKFAKIKYVSELRLRLPDIRVRRQIRNG